MGNQQSVKEPKPNLSTLGAVSSIRSSRKPRVPKDSRILGSNNIFTEHHGESLDDRKGPSWITQNGKPSLLREVLLLAQSPASAPNG